MTSESQNAPAGVEARPPAPAPARTPSEIESEIERTRVRLAGTVDKIVDRVKPANVARRGVDSAKAQIVEPDGSLRPARAAILAGGVLAVVMLVMWRRRR